MKKNADFVSLLFQFFYQNNWYHSKIIVTRFADDDSESDVGTSSAASTPHTGTPPRRGIRRLHGGSEHCGNLKARRPRLDSDSESDRTRAVQVIAAPAGRRRGPARPGPLRLPSRYGHWQCRGQ
jgi:hypothetical protein